jgi:glycosyltransferase involved in cell wall biosynthesis
MKQGKPVISVAQLGARMHYAVPRLLQNHGMLKEFFTDFWYPEWQKKWPMFSKLIPRRWSGLLETRNHTELHDAAVVHFPRLAFRYNRGLSVAGTREEKTEAFLKFGQLFCGKVLEQASHLPDIVYGFNTASLEVFEYFNSRGIKTVLEQTLVPRHSEERFLADEYASRGLTYETGSFQEAYIRREEAEWEIADHIVCASEFVKKELVRFGVEKEKINVIPYGFSTSGNVDVPPIKNDDETRPLKLLFVGNGGYRKGIPYLIEACKKTSAANVQCTIVGAMEDSLIAETKRLSHVNMLGSVNRDEVESLYREHDLFVFPSLCEGSATVIYEAMAYGLAIVCTPNSGSVIQDGKEGRLIPTKNSNAIANAVNDYVNNPGLLSEHQQNALETSSNYSVEKYGERLVSFLKSI